MKYQTILDMLEEIAPAELMEPWDNSGVQIHTGQEEMDKILVCLDITGDVVEEAKEKGCDLIVSHHPLFFNGVKQIDAGVPAGKRILTLLREGISVFSAHTTFDIAPGGNNDCVAALLGLEDAATVFEDGVPQCLVTGKLPASMSPEELFGYVAGKLDLEKGQIRAGGKTDGTITEVAVCTGAGSEFVGKARAYGCQALITGDVKHHEMLDAGDLGMTLIDAGHYGTEKFFTANMAGQLRAKLEEAGITGVEVLESSAQKDPFMV